MEIEAVTIDAFEAEAASYVPRSWQGRDAASLAGDCAVDEAGARAAGIGYEPAPLAAAARRILA